MADIENLLDWVFSERFKLAAPIEKGQIFLTPTDARLVISAGNRSQRRILFLLLVRSISGEKAIALSEIGRIVGISAKSVAGSISRLKESGKIVCVSGGRYQTPEGRYVNMRNQYTVPHYMGSRWDGKLTFTMRDVKCRFDANYTRCLGMIPETELRNKLPPKEFSEYLGVRSCENAKEIRCIDQCAVPYTLRDEEFGEIIIYADRGNRLYPLVDILKCMGIKNLNDAVNRHSSRQIWYTKIGTRKVKKCFVDECYLALMLKRSRCPYKEKLAHW